ncbi:hypothetical protein [Pseudomonas sp. TTU2014-080ASC]|uniref:hypothetical protein n=1 Tax=Pseudomonas sp. TTU2014-080ASC TaxID=1729724 RepID=UPI00071896CD|nr:hypothetical protein [Pseudomonas sp. TTU2014-080ASC]KRW58580.1 hypothetical protein AO726_17230 [Pseudomonas sp. TTU2014-080ASC]
MSLQCPQCGSAEISRRFTAMQVGAVVGLLGGAMRGAGGVPLIESSSSITSLNKLPTANLNELSTAVMAGLVGAAGGCTLGAQLGEKLDRHVLAHNTCTSCGHRFNLPV